MRILRIAPLSEGYHGKGMYASDLWERVTAGVQDDARHPGPDDDTRLVLDALHKGVIIGSRDMRYGFRDARQLRSWVYSREWVQCMHSCGAVVFELEIPAVRVAVGSTQVVFNPDDVIQSYVFNILEVFDGE